MAEGLKNALNELKDAFCDLTSQETQTYVGSLDIEISPAEIDATDIKKILEKVKTSGNLKLAAVTRIAFDGDGIVLTSETQLPAHVQKAHEAAVEAGRNTREGLIELFSEMIGLAKG